MRHKGGGYLHHMLKEADPGAAEQIHPHNVKRIIRALEFHQQTGRKMSEHNEQERQKQSLYNHAYFVLTDERSRLYDRIDRRVDQMMEQGLLKEVRSLKERGVKRSSTAMQGLGYKELYGYLEGEYPLEEAVRIIKRDTRHFAKRQLTWFRREKDVIWIDRSASGQDEEVLLGEMLGHLREKGLLDSQKKM